MPPFVESERDALIAEIEAAFDGVSRGGGVSWSQSAVLDQYGSQDEIDRAKRLDRDASWQSLLSGGWEPQSRPGGFAFMDAIGFRYYLPAAMVISVRQGWDAGILFHLQVSSTEEFSKKLWSKLDVRQVRCVRRYINYMFVVSSLTGLYDRKHYLDALEGFWNRAEWAGS